jgi:hypothetical protein
MAALCFFGGFFKNRSSPFKKAGFAVCPFGRGKAFLFLKSLKKDGKRARPADPPFSCGLFSFSSLKF